MLVVVVMVLFFHLFAPSLFAFYNLMFIWERGFLFSAMMVGPALCSSHDVYCSNIISNVACSKLVDDVYTGL